MAIATGSQILAADVLAIQNIFHELDDSVTEDVKDTDSWMDWDLSAYCPDGTTAVLLICPGAAQNAKYIGARKNGSSDDRSYQHCDVGYQVNYQMICECDTNRVIEIYNSDDVDTTFKLIGYWANT